MAARTVKFKIGTVSSELVQFVFLLFVAVCNGLETIQAGTVDVESKCGGECVRCGPLGCTRCARVLVARDALGAWGECAARCPPAHVERWARVDAARSPYPHHALSSPYALSGRICYPHSYYTEIIIGSCVGVSVCVVALACAALYARCAGCKRGRRGAGIAGASRPYAPAPRAPDDPSPTPDTEALKNFHKQLDCLRPHAYTLLSILNNTRRQVRELYMLGNPDAAMAYSFVLSDLAKILILLNKKFVPYVPDEWPRLASWADRLLKRYNRMSIESQQQQHVGQLVDFLQPPASTSSSPTSNSVMTTFKTSTFSPIGYGTVWCQDSQPPSYSLIDKEDIQLAEAWDNEDYMRRGSIWFDDGFTQLGKRPQDELTTEL